ncbi:MAG: hypothetical protein JO209_00505 [Acidisphaera sp.]|nr:hypothetical protein [Acidisphaera sp.]
MSLELVTLNTADGIELDGAWYPAPGTIPSHAARVLVVHGLTWNFYRGPSRWLPPLLAAAGHPCLALNMRDHDLNEVKDFDLSHNDLAAGIAFLESRGRGEVVLLGHGYACNKLVCYPALSGDHRPCRRVLTTLGAIKAYKPEIWAKVLAAAAEIRGATLVVQGAVDPLIEGRNRADELVRAARGSRLETVLLEGGDHYFNGRHDALAGCVLDWLGRTERGTE